MAGNEKIMIKIKPQFQKLIPPLTQDEYSLLEQNILKEGCRDALVIWRNGADYLLDGHNRFEICNKHNLQFNTIEKNFSSDDEAKIWILDNQSGRRNLPDFVKYELKEKKAEILKEIGRAKQTESLKTGDSPVLSTIDKTTHNTQEIIAKELGWSTGKVAMADIVSKEADEETKEEIRRGGTTINKVYQNIKKEKKGRTIKRRKEEYLKATNDEVGDYAKIILRDAKTFISELKNKSFNLLITDPPYSTDVDDIETFVSFWLFDALDKVKDNGRAFICIGAYPEEILAYLNALKKYNRFILDCPLIWTYKNTLGKTPKMKYNLNYQMILHLYSEKSKPLDNSVTNEMFSVQEINAPDGRLGDRFHSWQKPLDLGLRLIKHSTKEGDKIFDCFAGSGTFLLAGAKLKRHSVGCEVDKKTLEVAVARGCKL